MIKLCNCNVEIGFSTDGKTAWAARIVGAKRLFVRRKRRSESLSAFVADCAGSVRTKCHKVESEEAL